MELARCLRFAPLAALVAVGATGFVRPPATVAGMEAAAAISPAACRPGHAGAPGRTVPEAGIAFRLEPVLDRTGTLTANRLVVTIGGAVRQLDLPPESFATGPVGGRILVGADDGRVSSLRRLDVAQDCLAPVATEAAVIRSAIAAPDGSIVEHHVDRLTRADLGVWRRPAHGAPRRILPPMRESAIYGPTFTTELRLEGDGRVVVSSCGERACRVRVLEPASGRVTEVDDTGPALGLALGRLVVRDACTGWPCAVRAVDLSGANRRTVLVAEAGEAALDADGGLVYAAADGTSHVLDLAGAIR